MTFSKQCCHSGVGIAAKRAASAAPNWKWYRFMDRRIPLPSVKKFATAGRFLLFLLPGGTWMFLLATWLLHRRARNAGR